MQNAGRDAALYEKAVEWVVTHMKGKRRKGGDRPMVIHSIRVGTYLDQAGLPIEVVVAGFLHDVIEDTAITAAQIEEAFGYRVRTLVEACSHDNDLHQTDRSTANEELFQRVMECGADAVAIKVADAADNIVTVHHLGTNRQVEFFERAERWLAIGRHFLLPHNPLVGKLARRIRRAKAALRL